ncbi:MAG: transposase [Acetomicrobium sp.]
MKEGLQKGSPVRLFPEANVVVDHFHVIADANKCMDEARRIEQDVRHKGKVRIPKKIFLIARENLSDRGRQKVGELLTNLSKPQKLLLGQGTFKGRI